MRKLTGIFHIVLNIHRITIGEEITLAMGLSLGSDPDVNMSLLPYSQTVVQTRATALQTLLGSRVTDPHPALTKQEQQALNDLSFALISDANEIARQANEVAKGDRVKFETIVNRIGLHPKKSQAKHIRIFEVRPAGKGSVHIILPDEKQFGNPTYIIQHGITTQEGLLPNTWNEKLPLGNAEAFIEGMQSGSILAIRYAVWVIPSHKKTGSTGKTLIAPTSKTAVDTGATPQKMVTLLPTNKQGKIAITYGVNYYHFSDAIYVIVP